jgi:hypothetical protein
MSILGILFSGEKISMICRVVMTIWECEHLPGQNVLVADIKFLNQDSQWGKSEDLRDLIIRGIWESVPSSQNLSKAFNVQQGKDEGSTKFMSHLKDQMRKYAGLDLEDPLGQGMLKFHFVTNSWPDIARKLQKLENWKNGSIEELLGEAQKVYVRREEEKQKQKTKIMLSTIKQINREMSNQYPIGQQFNRENPNQYPIGPQLAWPPSWGIRDQKVRR